MSIPRQLVLDANILIKYVIAEDDSPKVDCLLDTLLFDNQARIYVPDLLHIECANILWKKVRKGDVDADTAEASLNDLVALSLDITPLPALSARALRLACDIGISAYDACYLALAECQGVPLITADARLVNQVAGSGHAVVLLDTLQM